MLPDHTFADAPRLDIVLVPGGQGTRREVDNPVVIDWLRTVGARCTWVTSVCTGALLLHEAGFAQGKRVTTHWSFIETLRARGDVTVLEDTRYVRDGNLVTGNGDPVEPQITIPPQAQSVTIAADGTVSYSQPGQSASQVAGQIQLANFTNPAGLMTQALMANTDLKVIGICDTPSELFQRISEILRQPRDEVRLELADYHSIHRALDRYYSVFDRVGAHAQRAMTDTHFVVTPVTVSPFVSETDVHQAITRRRCADQPAVLLVPPSSHPFLVTVHSRGL